MPSTGMALTGTMSPSSEIILPRTLRTNSGASAGTAGRPALAVLQGSGLVFLPGPRGKLYFLGSEMEAYYPISALFHGQALNITVLSYAGGLYFGFTGCADKVPHLQRLAVYTGEAIDELERVFLGGDKKAGKVRKAGKAGRKAGKARKARKGAKAKRA